MNYFKGTIGFFLISAVTAYSLGGFKAILLVSMLAVLEVSLSFDNAIVNAAYLNRMNDKWKAWFITWGMLIAVFGMRLIFPLGIVSVASNTTPWEALEMAIYNPAQYASVMSSAHVAVAGFGMAFLTMVFLKFFFDKEKEVHWIKLLEKNIGWLEGTEIAFTLVGIFIVMSMLPIIERITFLLAGMSGLALYVIADWLGSFFDEAENNTTLTVAKLGIGGAIYLELQDASFSFDGVIGAFSMTDNLFLITMGLGVGAFAIRGLTLMLVEKGTLKEFKYLEASAFYAIAALATIMGISTLHEVPELVSGLIGVGFIGLGFISSILEKRNDAGIVETN